MKLNKLYLITKTYEKDEILIEEVNILKETEKQFKLCKHKYSTHSIINKNQLNIVVENYSEKYIFTDDMSIGIEKWNKFMKNKIISLEKHLEEIKNLLIEVNYENN